MSNIFWGALLVLIGLEIIVKSTLGINIPILRVAFGLFLIYAGIHFISGLGYKKKTIAFSKATFTAREQDENYQVMFGESTFNFFDAHLHNNRKIAVNTLFGSTTIIINQNIPTKITVDTSFGTTNLPDSTQLTHGSYVFNSGPSDQEPLLEIHARVSFGSLTIEKK